MPIMSIVVDDMYLELWRDSFVFNTVIIEKPKASIVQLCNIWVLVCALSLQ